MMEYLMISDAAKEVKVESHVLRYWEEELHLPIKRNELGHRYYTTEDIERFKQIKNMKEGGLQLKAIKMILRDGQLDFLSDERGNKEKEEIDMPIDIIHSRELTAEEQEKRAMELEQVKNPGKVQETESREDKAKRLQWILQQLIRETLRENNQELCREIKDSVLKELDYQFRVQEEHEEEREQKQIQRNEEYYQKMDELLRKKTRGFAGREPGRRNRKKDKKELAVSAAEPQKEEPKEKQEGKKRRHSIL